MKHFENHLNWTFKVDEVSNGVYQITGSDKYGRKVEMTGFDVDRLIEDCKKAVIEIDRKIMNK